jgi:antitoxin component of MazEF toxin-antitoxin module
MELIVTRWDDGLAFKIPPDMARELAIEEGSVVCFAATSKGGGDKATIRFKPTPDWIENHFNRVNRRLSGKKMTTPASELLREDARY